MHSFYLQSKSYFFQEPEELLLQDFFSKKLFEVEEAAIKKKAYFCHVSYKLTFFCRKKLNACAVQVGLIS